MFLPLYTVATGCRYFDCATSDDVKRVLYRLGENDMFHRPPADTVVYLFLSGEDITEEFIKRP